MHLIYTSLVCTGFGSFQKAIIYIDERKVEKGAEYINAKKDSRKLKGKVF